MRDIYRVQTEASSDIYDAMKDQAEFGVSAQLGKKSLLNQTQMVQWKGYHEKTGILKFVYELYSFGKKYG